MACKVFCNSKYAKFETIVVLLLIVGYGLSHLIGANNKIVAEERSEDAIKSTFIEFEINRNGRKDYSQEWIASFVQNYLDSTSGKVTMATIMEEGLSDKNFGISVYKDKVDGQAETGWVVRFQAGTEGLGLKKTKDLLSMIGQSFTSFEKENTPKSQ